MATSERATHCPRCLNEYGPGVSICPVDGTLLVSGPDTQLATERTDDTEDTEEIKGAVTVFHRLNISRSTEEDDSRHDASDLFWQEEHPLRVRLAIVAREDALEFVAALEGEGVGAHMGDPTPEDGVEIIVHDVNLAAAQAILVDFTGDPSLVDDIEVEPSEFESDDSIWPDGRPDADGFVEVSSARFVDLDAQASTLAAAGIDVHMEIFDGADPHQTSGTLWIAREDLDRARETLHIEA